MFIVNRTLFKYRCSKTTIVYVPLDEGFTRVSNGAVTSHIDKSTCKLKVMESKITIYDSSIKRHNYEKPEVKIVFLDISHLGQTPQFICCCAAVFVCYLIYGYLQELIFTLDGFKPYGWYLTLVQFAYYTIFGVIEKYVRNITRQIPFKTYLLLAVLTLGTMGLSNSSLGYLNYPTQVIFKCCKLIPVLVGSIIIQGKRYGPLDFTAAIMMCIGLTLFTLADSQVSPNFNTTGVIMISSALLCDAIIGNVQEKAMKAHKASNTEVVLYSYFIGFVYLFVTMTFTGDLFRGYYFCANHPTETYGYAFLFSLSGYLGIQIVLTLVRTCGAFAAATVTTCRKAVTIVISFVFFSKPFVFMYLWSGLIVVIGIYLNIVSKRHPMSFIDIKDMFYSCIRSRRRYKGITNYQKMNLEV